MKSCKFTLQLIKYTLQFAKCEVRILSLEPNNSVQRCHQWLQNKVDNDVSIAHFEQKSVIYDGSVLRNACTNVLSFYPGHGINESKNIDRKSCENWRRLVETNETCVCRSILWWQEDVSKLESSICSLHRSVTCNRKVQVTAVMPVSLEKHSKLLKVLGILQLPMKQPKKDLKESMGDQKESYNILWKTWQLEKLANY